MTSIQSFFKMEVEPFSKSVDTEGLFETDQFKEMVTRLLLAAEKKQFVLLSAPVGCGKSTLLRTFTEKLPESKFKVIYITSSKLTPRWMYNIVLEQFGKPGFLYRGDGRKAVHEQFAITKECEGKNIICIIDEAHLLDRETLEETRFFLNAQMDSVSPLTLILAGQPELKDKLRFPMYEAIRQRIQVVCSLSRLDRMQTEAFIKQQLAFSKTPYQIVFTSEAIDAIYAYSQGSLRLICNCAYQALMFMLCRSTMEITGPEMKTLLEEEMI